MPELSHLGKKQDAKVSIRSAENHDQIEKAISEARVALESQLPGVCIASNKHYQLSNRIAFAWKLASLGIPTVLLYLGFTGDTGITDVGPPFNNEKHWQAVFSSHLRDVCPSAPGETMIDAGAAQFWILSRSRAVLEISPPAPRKRPK